MSSNIKIAAALAAIPAIFGAVLLSIFAFSILWGWFIVPFGAMPLSMAHAAGVSLTFNLLTAKFSTTHDVERNSGEKPALSRLWSRVMTSYAVSAFALLFGWVIVSVWGV